MYKVLVADDEHLIIKGIEKILTDYTQEYEVTASAGDGDEALELLSKQKFDVLITDIRMPGIDGIELLEKARALYPELVILILSGYEEIEYYQKAIQGGVFAYVLKPLDINEFVEVMDRVGAALSEIKNTVDIKRSALFNSLLMSDKHDSIAIREDFHKYGIKLSASGYSVIVIHMDNEVLTINELNASELESMVNNIIILANTVFQKRNGVFFKCTRGKIAGIINSTGSTGDLKEVAIACRELVELISTELFCSVSMGIGEYCKQPNGLKKSYESAVEACKFKFYSGHRSVNSYIAINTCEVIVDISLEKKQIHESLERLDYEELKGVLNTINNKVAEIKPKFSEIEKVYYQVFGVLEDELGRLKSEKANIDNSSAFSIEMFKYMETLEEMHKWVVSFADQIVKVSDEYASSGSSKAIRTAINYIHLNFDSNISLNDVAREVYMHPVYLSQLFKSEVGMNFTEYLNNLRMEKAKEYLKNLKYKVRDVAQMLGYLDEKHFYKVFKKNVGMTPNEYRNKSR